MRRLEPTRSLESHNSPRVPIPNFSFIAKSLITQDHWLTKSDFVNLTGVTSSLWRGCVGWGAGVALVFFTSIAVSAVG
jgi:hypothetical protein